MPESPLPFHVRKIGHVVLNVSDLEAATRFYTGLLGLQVSDRYNEGMVPGGMVFLRCNTDHHGVALVGGAPRSGGGPAAARGLHRRMTPDAGDQHPDTRGVTMRIPAKHIHEQLVAVLRAWEMSDAYAETTAEMMVETDLRGVDSHGISMLPTYDQEFRNGRLNMRPVFKTVRDAAAMALIDADASLGHPVSVHAMNLAVDKCLKSGVAVVS